MIKECENNPEIIARQARRLVLEMTSRAGSSHVGSALSVVEILVSLYSNFEISSSQSKLVFSKGHAASAYYAILFLFGQISELEFLSFGKDGTTFGGHVSHGAAKDILLSTGSLGHGFPYGVGIAYAEKLRNQSNRVFIVISDGECNEGSTWESALIANKLQLSNLVVIIDRNRIQSLGETEKILPLEPLSDKWKSFNWNVIEVNGHSHEELTNALKSSTGPLCIIAKTVKGKGVSFMENSVLWHYRPPSDSELRLALDELGNI